MKTKRGVGRLAGALLVSLAAGSCGDDRVGPSDLCGLAPLPLSVPGDGPSVIDVSLEIQGAAVVVHATATDPQGDGDLIDVIQSVGVFRDERCSTAPIVLEDDLAGSGIEETFGTALEQDDDPDLFDAIAASATWPVELDFRDASGNRVNGRVAARVD